MTLSQIAISPVFPLWLISLFLFLGLGAAIYQYWLLRKRLGSPRAAVLSLLRLGALFLIISFALNFSLWVRKEQKVTQSLAILLDTSQSMNLPRAAGRDSRLDEAKGILLDGPMPLLKSLAGRFNVKLFGLGESLRSLETEDLGNLKAGGKEGDLTEAIDKLADKHSMVVLLSDGNLKWKSDFSKRLPVVAVPMGDPKGYQDILIKAIQAPAMAFRGREVVMDVTVKGYGYKGLTLPVHLKEGRKLITAKNISFNENAAEVTIPLSFTPEELGSHHLSIGVSPQFGESLTSNNTVSFSLKVMKDKIRILMISGCPSLSYRFMRMAFKNDPSIDLLSFVILRTPSDIINVPLQEQSLIPLPIETLFAKELKNFDLLIFDNLPSHLYLKPTYFESVREFVRGGGSFAMIGGPFFSDEGGYIGSAIEEILPVRLSEKEDYRRGSSWRVRLSRAGKDHPITRFSSDEEYNINLWKEMPPLDGINVMVTKNSGATLLESEDRTLQPILAVGQYGSGRVMVLATDYSWKWYMGMVAKGKDNWPYLTLMERMVRWLTKDPSLDSIQITLPEKRGWVGQEMEIRFKVREENILSSRKRVISMSVFDPRGLKIKAQVKTAGQGSDYLGSFLPEKEGTYTLKIETPTSQLEEHLIIPSPLEGLDARPHPEGLKMISADTGGRFLSSEDDLLKEIETYAKKTESCFIELKSSPLWERPYSFIFVLVLLTTEWYLRKRWGLV
jgi:uncharacterized membrane protein